MEENEDENDKQEGDVPKQQPSVDDDETPSPALPQPPTGLVDISSNKESDIPLELPSTPAELGTSSIPNLPDTPTTSTDTTVHPSSFSSFPPPAPARAPAPTIPKPDPMPAAHIPATSITPAATPSTISNANVDDNSVSLAQKHARWAVSALTFDDVNTAVKELRESLKCLGTE